MQDDSVQKTVKSKKALVMKQIKILRILQL